MIRIALLLTLLLGTSLAAVWERSGIDIDPWGGKAGQNAPPPGDGGPDVDPFG